MKRDTSSVGACPVSGARVHHVAQVVAQHPRRPARHHLLEPREEVDAGDHDDARAHRPAPRGARGARRSTGRPPAPRPARRRRAAAGGRCAGPCRGSPSSRRAPAGSLHATRKVPRSRQPAIASAPRPRRRRSGGRRARRRWHLVEPGQEPHRPEQRRRLAGQVGVGPGGEAEQQERGDRRRACARTRPAGSGANSQRSSRADEPRSRRATAALVQRASARAVGRRAGRSPRSGRCAPRRPRRRARAAARPTRRRSRRARAALRSAMPGISRAVCR